MANEQRVPDDMTTLVERPTLAPPRISGEPEWAQVVALFRAHGLGEPPWRLRDELVGWLVWARYGAARATVPTEGEGVKALTAEQRETLALIVYDLREHSNSIHDGIAKHGSYSVPWGVLSWGKDMSARHAEQIEEIVGDVCRQCGGRGIIDNPEARYERDRDTGQMETNDPEEIECPECDGTGIAPPPRPSTTPEEEIAF